MTLVRYFPHEIEADLAFRGIDIADWHQGKMSSRRLLVLLEGLPDDSLYRKARRDGDWSDGEYLRAALINEVRLLRVDQAALQGQKMEATLLRSPAQLDAEKEEEAKNLAVRTGILAQLHGRELGEKD
jgi:hypothetical protein